MSSMVQANALVLVPAGQTEVISGEMLDAIPLANFWEQME
jgi:molybdopterin biosynthesis enzyme